LEWVSGQGNSDHWRSLKKANNPSRVGELNDNCKLSESTVLKIREFGGKMDAKEIARMFNTTHYNVYNILKGKTWKHLNQQL